MFIIMGTKIHFFSKKTRYYALKKHKVNYLSTFRIKRFLSNFPDWANFRIVIQMNLEDAFQVLS